MRWPVAQAERNPDQRDGHNSYQNGAAYPPDHQNCNQDYAQRGEKHLRIGDLAQPYECRWICDDDFGVPKSNEGDKYSDSRGSSVLQAIGDAVHNLFADVGEREQKENQTREKNHSQRRLPRHAATDNDRIREVRVQRHAGRESDRIICPQTHTHDQRRDRGGNASGEQNAFDGHSGFREDARIDYDHVAHGHECGDAGEKLLTDRCLIFFEVKQSLQQTDRLA